MPAANFNHPVWQKLRDFSRQWANPISPLYENADNIWLEFDLDRPPPEIPIPSLFFGPKGIEANTIEYQWVSQTALKVLLGRSLSSQVEENLETCFKYLPPGAKVFQIGVMLSRESDAVRICIRGIKSDRQQKIIRVNNEYHGISYYLDTQRAITNALVTLALSESSESSDLSLMAGNSPPRYQCRTHSEYIAKFALSPYVTTAYTDLVEA